MSRVPFSKYYVCSKCGAGFLRLLDTVQLRMPGGTGGLIGDEFSRDAKKKFVLVSSAIAGLVYACYQLVISLYESVLP